MFRRFRFANIIKLAQTKRINELKQKYPNLGFDIDYLVEMDPSGNYKYVFWQVRQLKKGFDPEKIAQLTEEFHKNQKRLEKKDIFQYSTVAELDKALGELQESKSKKRRDQRQIARGESTLVYEDDNFLVVRPESRQASCHFGKGTKWCVSMEKEDYYEGYALDNIVIYFILNKRGSQADELSKVAITLNNPDYPESSMLMYNILDQQLDIDQLQDYIDEVSKDSLVFNKIFDSILQNYDAYPNTELAEQRSVVALSDNVGQMVKAVNNHPSLIGDAITNPIFLEELNELFLDLSDEVKLKVINIGTQIPTVFMHVMRAISKNYKGLSNDIWKELSKKEYADIVPEEVWVRKVAEEPKILHLMDIYIIKLLLEFLFSNSGYDKAIKIIFNTLDPNILLHVINVTWGLEKVKGYLNLMSEEFYAKISEKSLYDSLTNKLNINKLWDSLLKLYSAHNDSEGIARTITLDFPRMSPQAIDSFLKKLIEIDPNKADYVKDILMVD